MRPQQWWSKTGSEYSGPRRRWLCQVLSPNLDYTGCSYRSWVLWGILRQKVPACSGQILTRSRTQVLSAGQALVPPLPLAAHGQGPSPPWLSFPQLHKGCTSEGMRSSEAAMVTYSRSLAEARSPEPPGVSTVNAADSSTQPLRGECNSSISFSFSSQRN